MRSHSWFAIPFMLMMSLTGCSVWSTHPAVLDDASVPDVTAWLGDWQILEIATQGVPASVIFRVAEGSVGEISLAMPTNAAVEPRRGVVATIGDGVVLSIEREEGVWDIFRPVANDDGTVDVFTWDLDTLRDAVADGVIAGSGLDFSLDGNEIEVRELSSALADKLLQHPELLALRIAIIRRVP